MLARNKKLSIKSGVALGIGSIMGSGILFLPSLTYFISRNNVAYVWIIATALCIPLLVIFSEMVRDYPSSSGIEDFVSAGLGENIGSSVTILLISTVIIGMPSASIIAGKYASYLFNHNQFIADFVPFLIVSMGIIANLINIKTSSNVQVILTLLLIIFAFSLILMTVEESIPLYNQYFSEPKSSLIFPGITVAFWAFAGFENLTFIAADFHSPEKDFKISMILSIVICGLIYFFLSINFASLIKFEEIDVTTGLYQLAGYTSGGKLLKYLLSSFAFVAVLANFISWIYGVSRLINSSAKKGKFFNFFKDTDNNEVPVKSIMLLGTLYFFVLLINLFFNNFIEEALVLVSTNFLMIYILCILSYIKLTKSILSKIMGIVIFAILFISTLTSGVKVLYGLCICIVSVLIYSNHLEKRNK